MEPFCYISPSNYGCFTSSTPYSYLSYHFYRQKADKLTVLLEMDQNANPLVYETPKAFAELIPERSQRIIVQEMDHDKELIVVKKYLMSSNEGIFQETRSTMREWHW